jgi:triphosphoribosyl-dephospho-CoA synthase
VTLPVGLCAQLACIWEATARKPGNVHRFHDFADTTYLDFILSAVAIAPVLETASQRPVGATVLAAITATRQVVQANTNLGIVLLLAPLAKAAGAEPNPPTPFPKREGGASGDSPPRSGEGPGFRTRLETILASLDLADSRDVYAAIRLAQPGGLGKVREQDVHDEPTLPLRELMALAAERDLIARQYVDGFREVLDEGVPALAEGLARAGYLEEAIVFAQLVLLAQHPDSLIARKRGAGEAEEASRRAGTLLDGERWRDLAARAEFDAWLRELGNQRNPGTTADLLAASLFAGLQLGTISASAPWC